MSDNRQIALDYPHPGNHGIVHSAVAYGNHPWHCNTRHHPAGPVGIVVDRMVSGARVDAPTYRRDVGRHDDDSSLAPPSPEVAEAFLRSPLTTTTKRIPRPTAVVDLGGGMVVVVVVRRTFRSTPKSFLLVTNHKKCTILMYLTTIVSWEYRNKH